MKLRIFGIAILWLSSWVCNGSQAGAFDFHVSDNSQFASAFSNASPGDNILLQPGNYNGGRYRLGLSDVTIRSVDPANRAVIQGGTNGIQLSSAQSVTLQDLVFEGQAANGVNIDDGGNISTPSTDITLRRVTFRDIGSSGNHDGVKLSGVNDFLLDQVEVLNWGNGGSAVDMVGSHRGVIQNSYFFDPGTTVASAVRPKGGSKDITIRGNRIELPSGAGRAIQAGGSTGTQYFRFLDGDSGYEADEIIAEGNVIIGGVSAFSFVNIDGGLFHHNYVQRPRNWTVRILNENQGNPIVDTQNGVVRDNSIVFSDTPGEYSTAVNIGPETLPETFTFARNQWLNLANPTSAGSTPQLPVTEASGIYGQDSGIDPDEVIAWDFEWGVWLVNASSQTNSFTVANPDEYQEAVVQASGNFVPSGGDPFVGAWQYTDLTSGQLQLEPFSQLVLRLNSDLPSADANDDGQVDGSDFLDWQAGFGTSSPAKVDGDFTGDSEVDANDLALWHDQYGSGVASSFSSAIVPEPTSVAMFVLGTVFCGRLSRKRH
ncbi:PEP-CTERM sorting domain-containing protein [Adhaeretor mobilis]|uniref:Probable pectate lyase C n=1 Tax=Adhaeretor mobilis TaxID=1930276 RepID=A0A517MU35_9BACT|nr:right-handed parallel beta-helix repeat-containing protein [Adhaeretor mobilis]QDS98395.1 hypothetical protein HG15A2_16700 [Adhaeretor mobilis]